MATMKLTHEDIDEFKQIYREEYGEDLSDVDAEARANQLLRLCEVVFQILTKERHFGSHDTPSSSPSDHPEERDSS